MSISQNFPTIRPTLNLNFARSKTLDPRITFTRASTATYVDEDGLIKTAGADEARFDHDPVTGESLGLLIEESRSNLLTRSQEFDDVAWGKNSCSVLPNVEISPDGTLTADKIVENTTSSVFKVLSRSVGTISGQYTLSVFLKAGERFRGYIQLLTATVNSALFFNLTTGTITGGLGINTITKYPNGWYRISTSSLYTSDTGNIYIVMQDNNGVSSYVGDGSSGMYVWGAQLEQGAFPTSYIPASGSTVTRQPDNASITGSNFTEWYNQSEGTLYTSHIQKNSTDTTKNWGIFSISNASLTSFIRLFSGSGYASVFNILSSGSGSSVYTTTNGSFVQNNIMRVVCSYSSSSAVRILNNNALTEDTSVVLPSDLNNIIIGGGGGGVSSLNGTISQLTYYPTRLSNQVLQNLTK